ncbi:hypothetical protein CAXC1_330124 [Candidatus Xenohaliotis californiensis]|uniref:AsmA domain-containing protein n=1 Tax=Candidatus Xenohaliotis californiensis TaxID=84677 RepID=A0ABP0EVW0_9RICK|nr:hypothetical protein CAXC1_330124 [Candidatus Xenohaliotis californiensis]
MNESNLIKLKSIFFFIVMGILIVLLVVWMVGAYIISDLASGNLFFHSARGVRFSATDSNRVLGLNGFFAVNMKNPSFDFTKVNGSVKASNLLIYSDILAKNLIFDLKEIKSFDKNGVQYPNTLDNLRIKIAFSKSLFLLKMKNISIDNKVVDYINIANINSSSNEDSIFFSALAKKVDIVKGKATGWDVSIVGHTPEVDTKIDFFASISALDSFYVDVKTLNYTSSDIDVDMGGVIAAYSYGIKVQMIIESMNMFNFINDLFDKLIVSMPWHDTSIFSQLFLDNNITMAYKQKFLSEVVTHNGKQRLVVKSDDNTGQLFIGSKSFNTILAEVKNDHFR